MPRGVDLVWHRGPVPPQYDEAGTKLPKPSCISEEFLIHHGPSVVVYRLDRRDEGVLMVGFADDGEAKRIAREEPRREVPEGWFGQVG